MSCFAQRIVRSKWRLDDCEEKIARGASVPALIRCLAIAKMGFGTLWPFQWATVPADPTATSEVEASYQLHELVFSNQERML